MRTSRKQTRSAVVGVALSASIGLVACGGSAAPTDTTAAEGEAQVIDIVATDYEFEGAPEELTTGPVELSFSNEGEEPHMLIFAKLNEGSTLEDAIKAKGEDGTTTDIGTIPPVEPGQEAPATISADITEAGEYFMLCPLETKDGEFHFDLGQLKEYEVQ